MTIIFGVSAIVIGLFVIVIYVSRIPPDVKVLLMIMQIIGVFSDLSISWPPYLSFVVKSFSFSVSDFDFVVTELS
jgi:hypothetical protein